MHPNQQALNVLKKHGRSFYFASHLLGQEYRIRAARLYAFCRHADDLVDESNDLDTATRDIEALRKALRDSLGTMKPNHSTVENMLSLMDEIKIPHAPVLALIEGMQSDLGDRNIQNEAELLQYAYQVAGTVGLMMCKVLDVHNPKAWPFALDLGIAMQLTNIARDVAEDAAKGRVYLPADWIGGLQTDDVLNPTDHQALQINAGVQKILALAEVYYRSGLAGVVYLPTAARYGILVAAAVYREIGRLVKRAGIRSLFSRTVVPKHRKLWCAFKILISYWMHSGEQKFKPVHDQHLHKNLRNCFGANLPTLPNLPNLPNEHGQYPKP